MKRFESVKNNLITIAEIVPLNSEILKSSAKHQKKHDLSFQNAIIYYLKQNTSKISCFLNKNSKDFDDFDITKMLKNYQCSILSRFNHVISLSLMK